MGKENWDYAITMYTQASMFDPGNLVFRQTLRGVEKKKYKNNQTGAKLSGMKLAMPKAKVKKARMKKDWPALDHAAEEGLAINPWDAHLNAEMGEACANQGLDDVAVFGFESAVKCEPDNKRFWAKLAELYQKRGEYPKAANCYERIAKIDPNDHDARAKSRQISAEHVIDRGGYEGADTTKDAMADHEVAKRLKLSNEGQVDGPGMSEEADLQRAVRKEPENLDTHLKLADFQRRAGKLDQAAESFQKAFELSGGDQNISEQIEDIELDQLRQRQEKAKEAAAQGDEEKQKESAELAKELLKREIEIHLTRVKSYPADLKLKFRLGQLFMRVRKWPQSIQLFQQSSQDQRLANEALVLLGECFIQDKKSALAKRQFQKAAPALDPQEKPDLFKKCYYELGKLHEAAGEVDEADNCYSEVLQVDYDYKDALARLEKLQAGE